MVKVLIYVIMLIHLSCYDEEKLPVFKTDKDFIDALKSTVFAYKTDSYDTLFSPFLEINYEERFIELQIDTLPKKEKRFLEVKINRLIFLEDSSSVAYFKAKDDRFHHFIIDQIRLNYSPKIINELFFGFSKLSLEEISQEILYRNNKGEYVVLEQECEALFQNNKEIVRDYFPTIIKNYDLNFGSEVVLRCYLYLIGEEVYLLDLLKNKVLDQKEEEIVEYNLSNFNINRE